MGAWGSAFIGVEWRPRVLRAYSFLVNFKELELKYDEGKATSQMVSYLI